MEEPCPPIIVMIGHKSNRLTALGIDNFGKQVFRYGYEDFDYVDDDVATDEDSTDESGKAWVFNAATSTFYNRLRLLFAPELRSLYNTLDGNGAWNAEDLITQFDKMQSQFPEEVWRQDIIRKYIRPYTVSYINGEPDTTFLKEKMSGRRKYHRREFERNQEIYFASKYRTEDAKGNIIRLRAKDPAGDLVVPVNLDLTITPYMYMYVSVDYANGVVTRQYRGEPGVPVVIDYPLESGDIIAIESAPYLQSIGDISPLYTQEATLTPAIRLKEILLGNSTEGYANTYLQDATMPKDGLIETINIENIPSLDDELDVSTLRKLKTLLAKGSGITGLILAKNCLAETLSLPALSSLLSMKNLSYLKDIDIDSLENLGGLIIEDTDFSTIENFVIGDETFDSPNELTILDNAPNLKRVRLTEVDWTLDDATILERLYSTSIGGYTASGGESTRAYLSGKVFVPVIRQKALEDYRALWQDLEITYEEMIEQYPVTFVNEDGTVLDIQYVDKGEDAVDPITRETNPITTPTKESTVSTDYTFAGWDIEFTSIFSARTITATYTESTRSYTIVYKSKGTTLQTSTGLYGENVPYTGDIPTYDPGGYTCYLFTGWDKSGIIDGDKTVNAVFDSCTYTDTYFTGKDLSELRPVEIYAMIKFGVEQSYVESQDDFSFSMGHDYTYDDVESYELITSKTAFTGTNYIDTGICPMDIDRSFVFAVDYEFGDSNSSGATLVHCFDEASGDGFQLNYSSNPTIQWGSGTNCSSACASTTNREMLVIRHIAGETDLYVYTSNLEGNAINSFNLERVRIMTTDFPIVFGAKKILDGSKYSYEDNAIGNIYWAKVWMADLGDSACQELAAYIHEDINVEMCGFKRKYLSNVASQRSSMSFLASHVLYTMKPLSTVYSNAGGWGATTLCEWLNTRFYAGLPIQMKQLIKQVKVLSSAGEQSTEIVSTDCYIYIPAIIELANNKNDILAEPYYSEETASNKTIDYMVNNSDRIRTDSNGTAIAYCTRSPKADHTQYFWYVKTDGDTSAFGQPSNPTSSNQTAYGVVIEFSI